MKSSFLAVVTFAAAIVAVPSSNDVPFGTLMSRNNKCEYSAHKYYEEYEYCLKYNENKYLGKYETCKQEEALDMNKYDECMTMYGEHSMKCEGPRTYYLYKKEQCEEYRGIYEADKKECDAIYEQFVDLNMRNAKAFSLMKALDLIKQPGPRSSEYMGD